MNEGAIISLVALLGWLIIAGSAVASFRLGWSKGIKLALIWLAIFAGAYAVIRLLGVS